MSKCAIKIEENSFYFRSVQINLFEKYGGYPPMCDISTLGRDTVFSERSSE